MGQLAAHSAFVQGAEKVAIIDTIPYRLEYAKKWLPNLHTINFSKVQVSCVPCTLATPRASQNKYFLSQSTLLSDVHIPFCLSLCCAQSAQVEISRNARG